MAELAAIDRATARIMKLRMRVPQVQVERHSDCE